MVIAYLRVSTRAQLLENQEREIRDFAANRGLKIDRWHREVLSGKNSFVAGNMGRILDELKKGDCLIVSEISRISRSMYDISLVFDFCMKKKINLYSVKEGYRMSEDINSRVLGFALSLSAEIERNLISTRTREALALRKAMGVKLGRPKGSCNKMEILLKNKEDIIRRIENNESKLTVARSYNISRSTLYNFLRTVGT